MICIYGEALLLFQHCFYSLRCFNQQLLDEVHCKLRHLGEGLLAVVHIHLGHVQVRLLLVIASKWRLTSHQHVGYNPNTPENTHSTAENIPEVSQNTFIFILLHLCRNIIVIKLNNFLNWFQDQSRCWFGRDGLTTCLWLL